MDYVKERPPPFVPVDVPNDPLRCVCVCCVCVCVVCVLCVRACVMCVVCVCVSFFVVLLLHVDELVLVCFGLWHHSDTRQQKRCYAPKCRHSSLLGHFFENY